MTKTKNTLVSKTTRQTTIQSKPMKSSYLDHIKKIYKKGSVENSLKKQSPNEETVNMDKYFNPTPEKQVFDLEDSQNSSPDLMQHPVPLKK